MANFVIGSFQRAFILVFLILAFSFLNLNGQTVENEIEGKYNIEYIIVDSQCPVVGYLTLKTGKYVFEFDEKYELGNQDDLFFHKNPKGTYTIEYNFDADKGAIITKLDDNAILCTVRFKPEHKITKEEILLRYNELDNTVYFHTTINEIEIWSIYKKIEEEN